MEFETLREEVKEHEGYRNKVYKDTLGKRTIGYGHLCRDDEKWEDDKQYDHRHLEKTFEYDFSIAYRGCLLYTSPSPRDQRGSRVPSSA